MKHPAGRREADLAAVGVTGEDEVERPGWQAIDRVREVGEQDAQVGRRIGEPDRWTPATLGSTTHELDSATTDVDRSGDVLEQLGRLPEVLDSSFPAERVPRLVDVDVPEDGEHAVRCAQPAKAAKQLRLAASPREQVARDRDEIRLLLPEPAYGRAEDPAVQGQRAEMRVGEMPDAEPVELGRKGRQGKLEESPLEPLRLEEAPREQRPRKRDRSPNALQGWGLACSPSRIRSPASTKRRRLSRVSSGEPGEAGTGGGGDRWTRTAPAQDEGERGERSEHDHEARAPSAQARSLSSTGAIGTT